MKTKFLICENVTIVSLIRNVDLESITFIKRKKKKKKETSKGKGDEEERKI